MAELNNEDDNSIDSTKKPQDLTEDFLTLGEVDDESNNNNNNNSNNDDSQDEATSNTNGSLLVNTYDASADLPPWMSTYVDYRRTNHMVALHNEIVQFCKLMEPRADELEARKQLVERFTELVHSVFKNCQVDVFGSQVTGLCLPTSDIDIAIQLSPEDTPKTEEEEKAEIENNNKDSKEQEQDEMENWDAPRDSPLQRLGDALREKWIDELSYLEIIENTRVPLVKFTHGPTDISIDVCFNQQTGPQAAKLMHQYMDALPPLRPLTFVLKYFTASRGLNQPYTGGVGSFLLQMMIVSFLQHRERDTRASRRHSIQNLGALLIEFLEFYSTDFNFITTGISVRFDGFFFPKGAVDRKKDFWKADRPFSIAMENPFELNADVGVSSFRISVLQRAFEVAFKVLLSHVTEPLVPTVSILASILPPTDEMKSRSNQRRQTLLDTPIPTPNSRHDRPRKRQRR